jgi:DNA-directed RNA polymerase sigma subunit (sigma70/sigma32)
MRRVESTRREVLKMRFGYGSCDDPKTLQEIADTIGKSRERTRQLEAQGLAQLQRAIVDLDNEVKLSTKKKVVGQTEYRYHRLLSE